MRSGRNVTFLILLYESLLKYLYLYNVKKIKSMSPKIKEISKEEAINMITKLIKEASKEQLQRDLNVLMDDDTIEFIIK